MPRLCLTCWGRAQGQDKRACGQDSFIHSFLTDPVLLVYPVSGNGAGPSTVGGSDQSRRAGGQDLGQGEATASEEGIQEAWGKGTGRRLAPTGGIESKASWLCPWAPEEMS